MYAIFLVYKAPVSTLEQYADAHVDWLQRRYKEGSFLLSGQQRPRVGGFILAKAVPREAINAILAEDPYIQAGVAEYQVTDVAVRFTEPRLAFLQEVQ